MYNNQTKKQPICLTLCLLFLILVLVISSRWAQGYNGGKATYIDKDVICYLCGSNIKFIAEDGAETVFRFPGEGVGPFTAHSLSRCFAVAEQCLNPKIFVYVYPTFRQMSVLEGKIVHDTNKLKLVHSS